MRCLIPTLAILLGNCASGAAGEQAVDQVLALEEVVEFSGRNFSTVVYMDGEPEPGVFDVFVGENHPTHTVRWNSYRVNLNSGRIHRWDFRRDGWVSCDCR